MYIFAIFSPEGYVIYHRLFIRTLILLAINIGFMAVSWGDDTLTYDVKGSGGWHPYFIPCNNGENGILPEILTFIFAEADIKGERIDFPVSRKERAFESGIIDFDFISPSWLSPEKDDTYFTFSAPIIPIREHIIFIQGQRLPANFLTEQQRIKPHIGTVRGYLYHDEHMFNRVDYRSEKELIQALSLQRIEWGIAGDLTAHYWARELDVELVLGPIHSSGQLHMRLQKNKAHLLPRINAAIRTLKASGKLDTILARYTLPKEQRKEQ